MRASRVTLYRSLLPWLSRGTEEDKLKKRGRTALANVHQRAPTYAKQQTHTASGELASAAVTDGP